MKRYSYILLIFLIALGLLGGPAPGRAQDTAGDNQDQVLSGFEDEQPAGAGKKKRGGDDVLSGFEEEPAPAQGSAGGDEDALEGFEEEEKADAVSQASSGFATLPSWLDLGGSLSLSAGFNLDHDPPLPGLADYRYLSRLRTELNLEADLKLSSTWKARLSGHAFYDFSYPIKGRGIFAEEALESLEREAELDEAWVQGSLFSNLDLKFGRQVVVWGRSDNLRVTDVLNPLDSREPGLTDIEDLRLPATMTRLDLYLGKWNLSGIMVHEVRFSKFAPWGGDFYPVPYFPPVRAVPALSLENQEYGLALNGLFSGWDISLYGAYYFGEQRVEIAPDGFKLVHDRNWMAGAAANLVLGSWLFKAEAAVVGGLKFTNLPGTDRTRLDLLAGIEYTGFKDTTIALEVVNRHLFDYQEILANDPDDLEENGLQSAFRITRTFMNDTLEVTFLASTYGLTGDQGGFQRLQVKYDWTDNLIMTLGAVNYLEGDRIFFRNIGDKDRIFLEFRYHF
jgi:hypothetical protein